MYSPTSTLAFSVQLHPVVIHFPIALWIVALPFWLMGVVRRRDDLLTFGRWLLYLGSLGAMAAVVTGYLASDAIGHDSPGHDLVHTHRDLMIAATIVGALTAAAAFALRRRTDQLTRWLLLLGLVVTVGITAVGADRGGSLVYDYGVGTRPAAAAGHTKSGSAGHSHSH